MFLAFPRAPFLLWDPIQHITSHFAIMPPQVLLDWDSFSGYSEITDLGSLQEAGHEF